MKSVGAAVLAVSLWATSAQSAPGQLCWTNGLCVVSSHPELGYFQLYDEELKTYETFRVDCQSKTLTLSIPGHGYQEGLPATAGIGHDLYNLACVSRTK